MEPAEKIVRGVIGVMGISFATITAVPHLPAKAITFCDREWELCSERESDRPGHPRHAPGTWDDTGTWVSSSTATHYMTIALADNLEYTPGAVSGKVVIYLNRVANQPFQHPASA